MEDMSDVLQQIMESELDEVLGYEKSKRTSKSKPFFTNDDSLKKDAVSGIQRNCRTLDIQV